MILLDRRIGSGELKSYFKPYDITIELTTLDFGDCCFSGNGPEGECLIGMERKVIRDLIASMRDKRLSGHQLPGLLSTYHYVYLIIEGIWRVGSAGEIEVPRKSGRKIVWNPLRLGSRNVLYREVDHYLTTLSHVCGVIVYPTSRIRETVAFIASRYHWWNDKKWHQHDAHIEVYAPYSPPVGRGRVSRRTPSLTEKMAAQIPGVNKAAFDISNYFGSTFRMVNASVDDWERVQYTVRLKTGNKKRKVGHDRARTIYDNLRKK